MKKYIFKLLGISGILLCALIIVTWKIFSSDLCSDTVEKEIFSPDKKIKSVYYTKDCGATTNYSSQIKLVKSNIINSDKLIFIADGYYGTLNMNWKDDNNLIVSCKDCSMSDKIFKQLLEWDNIKIEYQLDK